MRTLLSFFFISWLMLTSCQHAPKASTAYNVVGSYGLLAYRTATMTDEHPDGVIEVTLEDADHISLRVQGLSGQTTITYAYDKVTVLDIGQNNLAQDCYALLYRGHSIGVASNDGISRYVELTPSSTTTLNAVDI